MNAARTRFWIAVALTGALWLTMMLVGGAASPYDMSLDSLFCARNDPMLLRDAKFITFFGQAWVLVPLALAAAAFLAIRRKRRTALLLIMVFVGRLLVELQKIMIARPRPDACGRFVVTHSYSFPSAHAANSMITFMAIALLLPVRQRNRAIAVGLALAATLQVGASRVMLGVHWPSDVIGGWSFGLLWVIVCMRLATDRPDSEPVVNAR